MKKTSAIHNKKQPFENFISSSNHDCKEKPLAACSCPLQNPEIAIFIYFYVTKE
jgi:hypothetical protein